MHLRVGKFAGRLFDEKDFPYNDFCDLAKNMAGSTGLSTDKVIIYIAADKPDVSYF